MTKHIKDLGQIMYQALNKIVGDLFPTTYRVLFLRNAMTLTFTI